MISPKVATSDTDDAVYFSLEQPEGGVVVLTAHKAGVGKARLARFDTDGDLFLPHTVAGDCSPAELGFQVDGRGRIKVFGCE